MIKKIQIVIIFYYLKSLIVIYILITLDNFVGFI